MKSTVVDESLSSYQPMYCSREYQASTRLIQQYEKSTPNYARDISIIPIPIFFVVVMTGIVIKMQSLLQLSVAKQPLACMIFSALELTSGIKILRFYIIFSILRLRYTKTTCSIAFKLTAFNNDTLGYLYVNFQSKQISFKFTINLCNTG